MYPTYFLHMERDDGKKVNKLDYMLFFGVIVQVRVVFRKTCWWLTFRLPEW